MTRQPIWIEPASPAAADETAGGGCGLCSTPLVAASCRSAGGRERCDAPRLEGDADQVGRVLAALRGVQDPESGSNIVDSGLIQSLRVAADEVELTLVAATSGCPVGSLLADDAFCTLRALLPDTDVYVQHERRTPWQAQLGGAGALRGSEPSLPA